MPAIILIILGGVIILPPITKRIPAFKFKKIALILLSSIVMISGIELGETNLSPEVLAKRKAESEAAAASQAALEAQEAAESASRAAEEAASKAAQEKAKSEAAAASQNEKDQKKIDEYKSLILRNYANPDGASKGDQSKFFGIADNYLVNDNGWTKSGGLIPTYTSPCGKKGCYADWERRIYAEYNKKKLSSTEITAFFEQFQ